MGDLVQVDDLHHSARKEVAGFLEFLDRDRVDLGRCFSVDQYPFTDGPVPRETRLRLTSKPLASWTR